jgi:hypothetical protein
VCTHAGNDCFEESRVSRYRSNGALLECGAVVTCLLRGRATDFVHGDDLELFVAGSRVCIIVANLHLENENERSNKY